MNVPRDPRSARGFSLIEVMVAVIVICVGLLGVAKMQAMSLSSSNTSRLRSLASIQAASLAASMHSNRRYWAQTTGAGVSVTVSNRTITSSSDGALLSAANLALGTLPPVACIGTQCTPTQLAGFDVAVWLNAVANLLPNALSTINCAFNPGVNMPPSCVIQISWSESAVSMNAQETQALALPTYTLYVEP